MLGAKIIEASAIPLPAPELRIRPPPKRGDSVFTPFGELGLLIENTSLPMTDMQGSGKSIESDGVDLARIRSWWTQCRKTHGEGCQALLKQSYPGRRDAGYCLRLVDVENNRVVVALPGSNYVALSYVWPKTDEPFKAYEKSFQRLSRKTAGLSARDDDTVFFDVPVERLPKTMRDALYVTRAIGERYLWIDALCIIQDDLIDLQRTVYKMDKIYGAASITIVMGDREGASLNGGRPKQASQWVGETNYIFPLPSMSEALQGSIWQSRGWTYQEWQFSKRKLVFVGGLAYYSCSRSSLQEDVVEGPYNMNIQVATSDSDRFYPHENEYCRHVESYSRRLLTNGTDILNAFQGVMHTMASQLHTDFCWGLPLGIFDGALLWSAAGHLVRRPDTTSPLLDASRVMFPSWSWAGWQGAIQFRPDYHSDGRSNRTMYDGAVNRLGHIYSLITWPWQRGFDPPPNGPDLKTIISDILHSGALRFLTSMAHVNVRRLANLFVLQEITGWKLDDGTFVTSGVRTCIVLSEVENPESVPKAMMITGRSPIITYNVMVVEETTTGVYERRGLVKITRKIWEACDPEIRWVTLV